MRRKRLSFGDRIEEFSSAATIWTGEEAHARHSIKQKARARRS